MNRSSAPSGSWWARVGHGSVRLLFALLASALIAAPFGVAWHRHTLSLQVTRQFATEATELTEDQRALAAALDSVLPARTPPVVLAYHDIRPLARVTGSEPDPRHHFVVTPENFDAQLTALKAAGYTSITSEEYAAYLAGGAVPERSVLITFDDGTHGLWTHADKILARHEMRAASFLITANVGAKRPYYLSWQEIDRMARSGRWDFQSHTHKMHARLPVDRSGTLGSELTHRRWIFEKDRLETLAEFDTKIRNDLHRSVQAIVEHGLRPPMLFAFPFSEGYNDNDPTNDTEAAAVTIDILRDLFAGSFTNAPPQPLPSGARAAGMGMAGRIEVTNDTTVEQLLDEVRAHTPVTPDEAPPVDRSDLWTKLGTDSAAPVHTDGADVRLLGDGRWQGMAFGPNATADWASYRASVSFRGLAVDGVENAALLARVGTGDEVSVQVSRDSARLLRGLGREPEVISEVPLTPGDQHHVLMDVSPTEVEVFVDGQVRLSVPASGGPQSYGGIGLSSSRSVESAAWPVFVGVTVTEGTDLPNVRSGVGVPVQG